MPSTAKGGGRTLYRGVPGQKGPKAQLAKQGIAKPRGTALDEASLRLHVRNEDVNSGVTSWTPDRNEAKKFSGSGGTIIEVQEAAVQDKVVSRPNVDGKYAHEQEIFLRGVVRGKPTKP